MTEMSRSEPVVLLAALLVVAALVSVTAAAVAAPAGADADASLEAPGSGTAGAASGNATTTQNESTIQDGTAAGSTLAGAIGNERATLDGQLQSRTYELRIGSANTASERAAVLAAIYDELSSRLSSIERRLQRLDSGDLPAGKRAYLRATTRVDAAVVSRLATSGEHVAQSVDSSTDLSTRFESLAERVGTLEGDAGAEVTVPDGVDLDDWDRPSLGSDADGTPETVREPGGKSQFLTIDERALVEADAATIRTLRDSGVVEIDENALQRARESGLSAVEDVATVNESALRTVDAATLGELQTTGVVDVNTSVLDNSISNVTSEDSLNISDSDGSLNISDSDGSLNISDSDGSLNISDSDGSLNISNEDALNISDGSFNTSVDASTRISSGSLNGSEDTLNSSADNSLTVPDAVGPVAQGPTADERSPDGR